MYGTLCRHFQKFKQLVFQSSKLCECLPLLRSDGNSCNHIRIATLFIRPNDVIFRRSLSHNTQHIEHPLVQAAATHPRRFCPICRNNYEQVGCLGRHTNNRHVCECMCLSPSHIQEPT